MTCEQFQRSLADLTAEDTTPALSAKADQHVRACSVCQDFLRTYLATLRATRQLPLDAPPAGLLERFLRACQGAKEKPEAGAESPAPGSKPRKRRRRSK